MEKFRIIGHRRGIPHQPLKWKFEVFWSQWDGDYHTHWSANQFHPPYFSGVLKNYLEKKVMAPYFQKFPNGYKTPEESSDEEETETKLAKDEYIVKKIFGQKQFRKGRHETIHFHVWWGDEYEMSQTYQKESDLNCENLLNEFLKASYVEAQRILKKLVGNGSITSPETALKSGNLSTVGRTMELTIGRKQGASFPAEKSAALEGLKTSEAPTTVEAQDVLVGNGGKTVGLAETTPAQEELKTSEDQGARTVETQDVLEGNRNEAIGFEQESFPELLGLKATQDLPIKYADLQNVVFEDEKQKLSTTEQVAETVLDLMELKPFEGQPHCGKTQIVLKSNSTITLEDPKWKDAQTVKEVVPIASTSKCVRKVTALVYLDGSGDSKIMEFTIPVEKEKADLEAVDFSDLIRFVEGQP